MRSRLARQALLPGVLTLTVLFLPQLMTAQEAEDPSAKGEDAVADAPAKEGPTLASLVPTEEPGTVTFGKRFHAVRLRVDGNLAGRVRGIGAGGTLVPIRATVSFVQNGQVIGSARSDERGRFQGHGLRPGVYSVLAEGQGQIGAFSVEILPFAEGATQEELLLDITLMPVADLLNLIAGMNTLPAPAKTPPVPPQYQPMMMGGGGGGGGLGALAGLAGLIGLAGFGGGEEGPASPFVP